MLKKIKFEWEFCIFINQFDFQLTPEWWILFLDFSIDSVKSGRWDSRILSWWNPCHSRYRKSINHVTPLNLRQTQASNSHRWKKELFFFPNLMVTFGSSSTSERMSTCCCVWKSSIRVHNSWSWILTPVLYYLGLTDW